MQEFFEKLNTFLPDVLTALVSSLAGYWLGVGSERRKEYNEIADEFYAVVNRELIDGAAHTFQLDDTMVNALRRRMYGSQLRKFDSALQAYRIEAQRTKQDSAGQVLFVDVESVNHSLRELARVVRRK
jgi:hypothetical protein